MSYDKVDEYKAIFAHQASYSRISDYGIIGNLNTVALVSRKGSIDFMPFTRFDSPTIFTALLDWEKGGYYQIAPTAKGIRTKQLYLPDTAVLLTRFLSDQGVAELTDFMPISEKEEEATLVRKVRCVKGSMPFRLVLEPRFTYGKELPEMTRENRTIYIESRDKDLPCELRLKTPIDTTISSRKHRVEADFTLEEGEELVFALEAHIDQEFEKHSLDYYGDELFEETIEFWNQWIDQIAPIDRWTEMVHRSAITLKLLTSRKYGSTVAAATFGLPEAIGGARNWDYRYTWIRDSAFTMFAFIRLGFNKEANAFFDWILRRCEEMDNASALQLMYAVDGQTDLTERNLDHLEGYQESRPVRIGNGASQQFQLDIYGELIDTVYLYNKHGGAITYEFWKNIRDIVDYVTKNWRRKDHGIWEVRDEQREFLYSRLMCWVAIDRAILIAKDRSFPAPIEAWRSVRDKIYEDIYENFWSEEKEAFVQYKGGNTLDASALLMPIVRFISPHEPRWIKTFEAIERELVTDSLVYRYRLENGATDGLEGQEATFSMCSFWYVENLAKMGQIRKARLYFEKMLGYANHLGLYSEEIGMNGDSLGNFPQAFTHLALISSALQLNYFLQHEDERV